METESNLRALKRTLCYYFRCQLLWIAAPFPNSGGTGEGERRFFRHVAEETAAALNRYHGGEA